MLYKVKGDTSQTTILKVTGIEPGGYDVVITRMKPTHSSESREFMSKDLFDTCVRTGYLTELQDMKIH